MNGTVKSGDVPKEDEVHLKRHDVSLTVSSQKNGSGISRRPAQDMKL